MRHAQLREARARGVAQLVEFSEPRLLSGDGLIELCLSEHHMILQLSPVEAHIAWRTHHTRRICGPLRSELASTQPKLVPQPADVGPGSAISAGALGAVLDPAQQQLELAAPPTARGHARRVASEQLEWLVQPAAVVVVEKLALEVVGFRRRQSGRWLAPAGRTVTPA